ncbi:MAG TPA: serine/threonine protein kinase, partial [Deltaproteobacteria bacterium]|nr:serine/threonine protein kinase [Deltaproteobacteria bacterium]
MPSNQQDLQAREHALPMLGDRYVVTRRIGKGGAAGVYLVFDRNLARWCAAKVLHRRFTEEEELRRRFLREARTMARLDHPNIVRLLDVADIDQPYMIMEYMEGGCVLEWLRYNGPMPPTMATSVMIEVCRALAATHAEHIVHRDIKPHNILVTGRGVCKLTDFGIAKFDPNDPGLEWDYDRTAEGATMGTDAFMSPEQRRDASTVTPLADVYSAGATLYTLCSRKAAVDLCMLDVDHPKLERLPSVLRPVVLRACHRSPEARYPTAEALEAALLEIQALLPPIPEGCPPLVQPSPPLPRGPARMLDPEQEGELADLLLAYVELSDDDEDDITLGAPEELPSSSGPPLSPFLSITADPDAVPEALELDPGAPPDPSDPPDSPEVGLLPLPDDAALDDTDLATVELHLPSSPLDPPPHDPIDRARARPEPPDLEPALPGPEPIPVVPVGGPGVSDVAALGREPMASPPVVISAEATASPAAPPAGEASAAGASVLGEPPGAEPAEGASAQSAPAAILGVAVSEPFGPTDAPPVGAALASAGSSVEVTAEPSSAEGTSTGDAVAAIPADAVPGRVISGDAVSGDAVSAAAVSAAAVPGDAVPGRVISGDAVPAAAIPGDAV